MYGECFTENCLFTVNPLSLPDIADGIMLRLIKYLMVDPFCSIGFYAMYLSGRRPKHRLFSAWLLVLSS